MSQPPANALRVRSIDPGDKNVGVADLLVWATGAQVARTRRMDPLQFEQELDDDISSGRIDILVVEAFRLYPKLAREQGYSDFPTPKLIGVIEFLGRKHQVPVHLQGASTKKLAIEVARTNDVALRKLQSGRMDFEGRTQHERDAVAHGIFWAYRGHTSPLSICLYAAARARQKA